MADPANASDRLRAHRSASSVPDGAGYHPTHHSPIHGEPLHAAALEFLRQRGAEAVFDDLAWRHDHAVLASAALACLQAGQRPGPAWRYRAEHAEVGLGPVREGLQALAFVLGLDLRADPDGVRLGLLHRRPPAEWSTGPLRTSAAFRQDAPAPGGLHDPELVGTRGEAKFAHLELPWRMLPSHLAPWVAGLLDRTEADLVEETDANGVASLMSELQAALERCDPPPKSLDGALLTATDFLWSEVAVVPVTFRRPVLLDGQRQPHGLDGTLHRMIAAARRRQKAESLLPAQEAQLRRQLQAALDAHLAYAPPDGPDDAWGWSVAEDMQGTLRVDGVMLDWGGRAVCVVEDRDDLGLPEGLRDAMPVPGDVGPVLVVHMPTGVAVAEPSWVRGACIRLPEGLADAMGAQAGDLLRVIPAVSRDARQELATLAEGVRMSPLPTERGFLDDLADAPPASAGRVLVEAASQGHRDRAIGPVGRRIFAGLFPPARGSDVEEVDRVHRGFHLLLRLAEGPGSTLPPGVAQEKLERVEAQLGRRVVPEVRALWTVHDGQMGDAAPLVIVDGARWRLLALDPDAARGDLLPLALGEGGEIIEIDPDGRIWRGEVLVGRSLGRLLQESYLAQRP